MEIEAKMKQLMKNGWTYVKGAKEYHDLVKFAAAEGYEVSDGSYLPGSMKIKVNLIVHA